jgi:glutathione peroxidase
MDIPGEIKPVERDRALEIAACRDTCPPCRSDSDRECSMLRRQFLVITALGAIAAVALAHQTLGRGGAARASTAPVGAPQGLTFRGVTGGTIAMDDWRGRPVLVVNTASRCGFTPQYEDMQALYDQFRDRGLVVLAVPSDDFNQELGTDAEVAAFCEVNFGLDFPMAGITPVRGAQAHPFYQWLAQAHGFTPRWNFHKVLLGPDGQLVGTWGSTTRPTSRPIVRAVEAALRG